ncbi:MAG: nucleoside triphosphate pyrophosphohydrolase [Dehalococcoidia bacterium]|nr:nucleoside triphosphate pyrophosphohydrolase [Dehalococcoidia bacterium]
MAGLGPGSKNQLTLEALQVLDKSAKTYLRTAKHPVVKTLPALDKATSFDYLYDQARTFEAVYTAIVDILIEAGRRHHIVYAVPGDPLVGEATVRSILIRAEAEGIPIKIVHGLSFLEPVFGALKLDPIEHGLQIVDAQDPAFDATKPAIFCQIYNRRMAGLLKVDLLERYPAEHQVTLVKAAGMARRQKVVQIPLFELDRRPEVDHLTCLYVPPLHIEEDLASLAAFEHIIARLRGPNGCPWDREQTHDSLKTYLLEEAYEVLDALDSGDPDKLCEELGDLLLQILLHSQIAKEADEFDVHDVLRGIASKIIRRHPHVFGDIRIATSAELLTKWEAIKKKERPEEVSMLASVPKNMPALSFAQAVQRRAASVGFDWPTIEGPKEKLAEELSEFEAEHEKDGKARELGDALFAMVNIARWEGIEAEEALRLANQRFQSRFVLMEEMARQRELDLAKMTLDELDLLWEQAKKTLASQQ